MSIFTKLSSFLSGLLPSEEVSSLGVQDRIDLNQYFDIYNEGEHKGRDYYEWELAKLLNEQIGSVYINLNCLWSGFKAYDLCDLTKRNRVIQLKTVDIRNAKRKESHDCGNSVSVYDDMIKPALQVRPGAKGKPSAVFAFAQIDSETRKLLRVCLLPMKAMIDMTDRPDFDFEELHKRGAKFLICEDEAYPVDVKGAHSVLKLNK